MSALAFGHLSLDQWLVLLGHFLLLSLLSVGGAMVVAPDIHRVMVGQMALINDAQFNASIAIAQAAPGPNVLFVAVLGYQVAGLAGALLVLAAVMLPSTAVAIAASRWSHARREWRSVQAFRAGLAPISIALLAATGWILSTNAPSVGGIAITVSAALLMWRTNLHLLWLIAAGALIGALGGV
jgi:chromate transporter